MHILAEGDGSPAAPGDCAAVGDGVPGTAGPVVVTETAGTWAAEQPVAGAAGPLMAATALGPSVGAIALIRVVGPAARQRLTAPLAFAACAVLTAVTLRPGLPGLLVILLVSGLCDSYQVLANAAFVAAALISFSAGATGSLA